MVSTTQTASVSTSKHSASMSSAKWACHASVMAEHGVATTIAHDNNVGSSAPVAPGHVAHHHTFKHHHVHHHHASHHGASSAHSLSGRRVVVSISVLRVGVWHLVDNRSGGLLDWLAVRVEQWGHLGHSVLHWADHHPILVVGVLWGRLVRLDWVSVHVVGRGKGLNLHGRLLRWRHRGLLHWRHLGLLLRVHPDRLSELVKHRLTILVKLLIGLLWEHAGRRANGWLRRHTRLRARWRHWHLLGNHDWLAVLIKHRLTVLIELLNHRGRWRRSKLVGRCHLLLLRHILHLWRHLRLLHRRLHRGLLHLLWLGRLRLRVCLLLLCLH